MSRRTVPASAANAGKNSLLYNLAAMANQLSKRVSQLEQNLLRDGSHVWTSLTPGFSIDANAPDVETDNAIQVYRHGQLYAHSAVAALDVSASATCAGDVVTNNKLGAFWATMDAAGALDLTGSSATPQAHASAIVALAQWALGADAGLVPPSADDVAIGALTVAPTGGDHTMGTTALTTVGTFYDCIRLPSVEVAAATFAKTAGSAATFYYGATTFVLGSGTRVAATGKTGVALAGSNVANGKVGAWLFYGLADDVEYALQLGAAYSTVQEAQDAIRDSNPNPLLALIGTIIIDNHSGATFIPGTTKWTVNGITATFTKNTPTDRIEVGRGLNGAFSAADDITTRELGMPS